MRTKNSIGNERNQIVTCDKKLNVYCAGFYPTKITIQFNKMLNKWIINTKDEYVLGVDM